MDKEWYAKTRDMTEFECWDELHKQHSKKYTGKENSSVWLVNDDITKWSSFTEKMLYHLFEDLNIKSVIDVGCSDAVWQSQMNWGDIKYTGIDIVKAIAEENAKKYPHMNFMHGDIADTVPPKADMIIVRNVFLHMQLDRIKSMVNNIKKSGSTFLLASSDHKIQINTETACIWARRIDLLKKPFNFPRPLCIVPEILPSILAPDGVNNYLYLWRTEFLPDFEV